MKEPLIFFVDEECSNCSVCASICPVKAIQIDSETGTPKIIENRCIGCGDCIISCNRKKIKYRDSKAQVKALLASKSKVAAIVAPSVAGEFDDITDYRKFVKMIKALGFDFVNEVSFGADLIARKYYELFSNFKGKYYITTNCPVVVSYIEKFHPELIDNLAPIVSPMIATSKIVHEKFGSNTKVVYIGPCIATKNETSEFLFDSKVDAVLTFVELRQLFDEFNIQEKAFEYAEFDPPIGGKGSLFPISGGLMETVDIKDDLLTGTIISTVGRENFLDAIQEFEVNIEKMKRHLDLFYCHGCIMGPGTSPGGQKFLRRSLVIEFAKKRLKTLDKRTWENNIDYFFGIDFSRQFNVNDQRLPIPPEEEIQNVLEMLEVPHSEETSGCSACGYKNCREFAISVAQGLAKTEMCHSFTMRKLNKNITKLEVANNELARIQTALEESERKAKEEHASSKVASEITSAMLDKMPSAVVIADENLHIIKANESFIELLGEDAKMVSEVIPGLIGADLKTLLPASVYKLFAYVLSSNTDILNKDAYLGEGLYTTSIFSVKKDKIVGAIIRDLQTPEVQREEVISRVSEVINEQLELVQKIAFLLGEGAAKSEKMLNSIIETYNQGRNDQDEYR